MQTTGTFPALYEGRKKSRPRRNSGTFAASESEMSSFTMSRTPRRVNAPKTLAGRRAASHRKARG